MIQCDSNSTASVSLSDHLTLMSFIDSNMNDFIIFQLYRITRLEPSLVAFELPRFKNSIKSQPKLHLSMNTQSDLKLTLSCIKRSMSVDGWYSDVIIKRVMVWRIMGWIRLSYVACSNRMAVPKIASKKQITCVTVNWKKYERKRHKKKKLNDSLSWMTR